MKLLKSSSDASSLNQQLVEQILGVAPSDRTQRQGSGTKHWTTPDAKPPKNKKLEQQQQQQEQQQQSNRRSPPVATRARGASGIPPPSKLDLADLEDLSPEEVRQVLYQNPDLADAYRAKHKASSSSSKKKRSASSSNNSRSKKGKNHEAHVVRDRAEDGIPIFQWIVVLFLLGLVIYQLRKILTLPQPTTGNHHAVKKHNKREPRSKTKAVPRSSAKSSNLNNKGDTTAGSTMDSDKGGTLPNKSSSGKPEKKTKKTKSSSSSTNTTKTKSNNINKNTEEKAVANNGEGNEFSSNNVEKPAADATTTSIRDDDDSATGTWQPVPTAKKATPSKAPTVAPPAQSLAASSKDTHLTAKPKAPFNTTDTIDPEEAKTTKSPIVEDDAPPTKIAPTFASDGKKSKSNTETEDNISDSDGFQTAKTNKKNKKNKQATKPNTTAISSNIGNDRDNATATKDNAIAITENETYKGDAALALQLQQEEQLQAGQQHPLLEDKQQYVVQLAETTARQEDPDDAWAQVPTKRSNRRNHNNNNSNNNNTSDIMNNSNQRRGLLITTS
jgi:hypothetical protein